MSFIRALTRRIQEEPALFLGLCSVAINTFVVFGLRLTGDQVAELNMLVAAMVAFSVRQQVTPLVTTK